MNCTDARERLPALVYGDLSSEETAALDDHLTQCPACRAERAELEALRRALDAAPAPAAAVDLPALYREAARHQKRVLRRWKRAAFAVGSLAAALLLVLALRLEVRVGGGQLVVRWGPPPVEPAPPPPNPPAVTPQPPPQEPGVPPAEFARLEERVRVLSDLVRAVAADVDARDRQQQEALVLLQREINDLRSFARRQWVETRRDVTALYNAQFAPR